MSSDDVKPSSTAETKDVKEQVNINKFSLAGKLESLKQGSFVNNLQADQIL
jgi:hypothetical protein